MLAHGEAKALLVDRELAAVARAAVDRLGREILLVDVDAPELGLPPTPWLDYETLLAEGDPTFAYAGPEDEWDAICLNYTSGTTGDPKGVVYHHRGAYLNPISNILEWDLPKHPVYLWTLPLFHCNGWCFAWTVAARAGTNVCLRKVEAKAVFDADPRAPRHALLRRARRAFDAVSAAAEQGKPITHRVAAMVAGAAPPAAMIEAMENVGFDLTHVYGLTEVYGPAAVCEKHEGWRALPVAERARLNARQGMRYHLQEAVTVLDPATMQPVPADGETMGEVMFRGNITMKGYLKNPTATGAAFAGGWFHTGDFGVLSPDGYVKIKDRSKDIIISGGENISSIEVEDALCRHPAVLAAAVVAQPDAKWGETPCAFIELRPGAEVTAEALIAFCKERLSRLQGAARGHLRPAAANLDREDTEVRAARARMLVAGHRRLNDHPNEEDEHVGIWADRNHRGERRLHHRDRRPRQQDPLRSRARLPQGARVRRAGRRRDRQEQDLHRARAVRLRVGQEARHLHGHAPDFREAEDILRDQINCDKPTIAKVYAPGAHSMGASIALACDFVYASDDATFSDPHLSGFGVPPGDGGALLWPARIGLSRAREFLMTDRLVHGEGSLRDRSDQQGGPQRPARRRGRQAGQEAPSRTICSASK